MPRNRLIAWSIAALSLVTLIWTSWLLALRIQGYNKLVDRPIYYFMDVGTTEFPFAGREVTLTQEVDDAGVGNLIARFGDEELTIPVGVPSDLPLPLMERQDSWFDVVFFADSQRLPFEEFRKKIHNQEIPYRCVMVCRYPDAGVDQDKSLLGVDVDEDSWGYGEVLRNRWTFEFHELLSTGGFASKTLRFPESGKSYDRRLAKALKAGEPIPERSPDELQEYTWEFQAALKVMPRPPAITRERQALTAAGWTLPVASTSVVTLMLSLAFALAPARVRETDGTDQGNGGKE